MKYVYLMKNDRLMLMREYDHVFGVIFVFLAVGLLYIYVQPCSQMFLA